MHASSDSKSYFIITELYSDDKGDSNFKEIKIKTETLKSLGYYSDKTRVKALSFRNSIVGKPFDFHTAQQKQYIVYLSGEAEIETNRGEKKDLRLVIFYWLVILLVKGTGQLL
jgi:hypothetical protein